MRVVLIIVEIFLFFLQLLERSMSNMFKQCLKNDLRMVEGRLGIILKQISLDFLTVQRGGLRPATKRGAAAFVRCPPFAFSILSKTFEKIVQKTVLGRPHDHFQIIFDAFFSHFQRAPFRKLRNYFSHSLNTPPRPQDHFLQFVIIFDIWPVVGPPNCSPSLNNHPCHGLWRDG